MMSLYLARSGGGSRRSVGIISANFTTVGGEELHEILVLGENFLKNICGYCCNGWCWIIMGDTVFHIFLVFKFGGEASHNVFHNVGLAATSLLQSQFSSLG